MKEQTFHSSDVVRLHLLFISFPRRSISASQAEDSGDRHVLPHRDIQPDGLWHSGLLARQRYGVARKIQGVALVTAGSVHGDLSWQLKDTELSA